MGTAYYVSIGLQTVALSAELIYVAFLDLITLVTFREAHSLQLLIIQSCQ